MSQRRLTARDFKSARRGGLDLGRWRDFGIGLGAGLVVALVIFVGDRRTRPTAEAAAPQPNKRAAAAAGDATEGAAASGNAPAGSDRFDFYEMLPKFEVVVPEKERDVKREGDVSTVKVDRPGVYVLQAGSYRGLDDAERVRAKLSRLGIDAQVQRVAVDADVWHRVRIGPVSDLEKLNRMRRQLRAADIDALLIRVGD